MSVDLTQLKESSDIADKFYKETGDWETSAKLKTFLWAYALKQGGE